MPGTRCQHPRPRLLRRLRPPKIRTRGMIWPHLCKIPTLAMI